MIALIVAHDRNRLIGSNGSLPWGRITTDLQWFKRQTHDHYVVMGRTTFDSIGKPLVGRVNIVLTRGQYFQYDNVITNHSIDEVLRHTKGRKLFVIGGAEIYKQFLPMADELYITKINREFEGDTYFPEYDKSKYTSVFQTSFFDQYELTFNILKRK